MRTTSIHYPYGMLMPERTFSSPRYRFGYQGSEKDDEIAIGDESTYYREMDTRICHWWSIDPKKSAHESPYVIMGNTPIWKNDILGDIVGGDEKGKENYKKYRSEVNSRIEFIKNKMKGLEVTSDAYKNLDKQLTSYNQINTELNALENDKKNLYYINSDVRFTDENEAGKLYYAGKTKVDGVEMNKIHIDLSSEMFPMNTIAHEFKHAYQFHEGRLILYASGVGGRNSQELEKEGFERGYRFSGNTLYNNKKFDDNYNYNIPLPKRYSEYPLITESILDERFKRLVDKSNAIEFKYVYNNPHEI